MKVLNLFALFLFTTVIHAQAACPPGTIPYGTGNTPNTCGPSNDQPQQSQSPPPPPQTWVDYWGAISTDAQKGILGAAVNATNQKSAEQAAINDCVSKGGTQCELQISFRNGCAAMVLSDKAFNVNSAPTLSEAVQKGMKMCTKAAGNCHVYYSTCSLPVRIQ